MNNDFDPSNIKNQIASLHFEEDGTLGVLEFGHIPFTPRRFFWLSSIDPDTTRASHAHRKCHQLLVCLAGEMKAIITGPMENQLEFHLKLGDSVHLQPLMWLELEKFTPDGVLGVLASDPYDPDDYINNYSEFEQLIRDHLTNQSSESASQT